jgi:hypothetical protein
MKNHLLAHFLGVEEFLSIHEIWAAMSSLILPIEIIVRMKFDV